MDNIVRKAFALKQCALDDEMRGSFSGTALVYGDKDLYGDTIKRGAFAKSLREHGDELPLLWSHDTAEPLGSIRVVSDGASLEVRGQLLADTVRRAGEVYELMKARVVKGLSVAFKPLRYDPQPDGGVLFSEGRLMEISLCSIPAFDSAQVATVKSITLVNFEDEVLAAFGAFNPQRWKIGRYRAHR